jgi:hypothetical protein
MSFHALNKICSLIVTAVVKVKVTLEQAIKA